MAVGIPALVLAITMTVSAKRKIASNNKATSAIKDVTDAIGKAKDFVDGYLVKAGVKLRKLSRSSTKETKSLYSRIKDSFNKSEKEALRDSENKANEAGAESMSDLRRDNTSSNDPPLVDENKSKDGNDSIIKNALNSLNAKFGFTESLAKEDKDGPSLKSLLKEISGKLSGDPEENSGKSRLDRAKEALEERMQRRRDEVELEKQGAKLSKKGKKSFGEKGIFGKLMSIAGLFLLPVKLLVKPLANAVTGAMKWGVKKLLKGTWWMIRKSTKLLITGIFKSIGWVADKLTFGLSTKLITGIGGKLDILKTAMGKWFGNLTSSLGNVLSNMKSGLGSWMKNAFTGVTSKVGGWVASKGGLGAAARFIGVRALGVLSGPVGWAILAGTALWAGYKLYKYLTDNNGDFPKDIYGDTTRYRFMAYGVGPDNKAHYKTILELEELAGRWFKYDPGNRRAVFTNEDPETLDKVYEVMGIDGTDTERDNYYLDWFYKRFLPAYQEFLRCLWICNEKLKPGELDQLDKSQMASIVYGFICPPSVWKIRGLPFKDAPLTTVSRAQYDEMGIHLKNELKAEWDELQKISGGDYQGDALAQKNKGSNIYTKNESDANNGFNGSSTSYGLNEDGTPKTALTGADLLAMSKGGMKLGDIMGSNSGGLLGTSSKVGEIYDHGFKMGEGDVSNLDGVTGSGRPSIDEAMSKAAKLTGVPEEVLWTFAKLESSLNPQAMSKTSSAKGLFQFLDDTWKGLVKNHGKKYGITMNNADWLNPLHQAIFAGEMMKENQSSVNKWTAQGLDLGTALYLGHFLGNGGSSKVADAYAKNPETPMYKVVGMDKVAANKELMSGTIGQYLNLVKDKFNKSMNTSLSSYDAYMKQRNLYPEKYKDSYPTKTRAKATTRNMDGSMPGLAVSTANENGGIVNLGDSTKLMDGSGPTPTNNFMDKNSDMQIGTNDVGSSDYGFNNKGSWNVGNQIDKDTGRVIPSMETYSINSAMNNEGGIGADGSNGQDGKLTGDAVKVHPIPDGIPYVYTSGFGGRAGTTGSKDHKGQDIGVPGNVPGTPIRATGDGRIIKSGWSDSYGYVVYIEHANGYQSRYAHMVKGSLRFQAGQNVKAGDVIGNMGDTRNHANYSVRMKTHLHYEIRKGNASSIENSATKPIDPANFPVFAGAKEGSQSVRTNTGSNTSPEISPNPMDVKQFDPVTGMLNGQSANSMLNGVGGNSDGGDPMMGYGLENAINNVQEQNSQDSVNVTAEVDTSRLEGNVSEGTTVLRDILKVLSELKAQGNGLVANGVNTVKEKSQPKKEPPEKFDPKPNPQQSLNGTKPSSSSFNFDSKKKF